MLHFNADSMITNWQTCLIVCVWLCKCLWESACRNTDFISSLFKKYWYIFNDNGIRQMITVVDNFYYRYRGFDYYRYHLPITVIITNVPIFHKQKGDKICVSICWFPLPFIKPYIWYHNRMSISKHGICIERHQKVVITVIGIYYRYPYYRYWIVDCEFVNK